MGTPAQEPAAAATPAQPTARGGGGAALPLTLAELQQNALLVGYSEVVAVAETPRSPRARPAAEPRRERHGKPADAAGENGDEGEGEGEGETGGKRQREEEETGGGEAEPEEAAAKRARAEGGAEATAETI